MDVQLNAISREDCKTLELLLDFDPVLVVEGIGTLSLGEGGEAIVAGSS